MDNPGGGPSSSQQPAGGDEEPMKGLPWQVQKVKGGQLHIAIAGLEELCVSKKPERVTGRGPFQNCCLEAGNALVGDWRGKGEPYGSSMCLYACISSTCMLAAAIHHQSLQCHQPVCSLLRLHPSSSLPTCLPTEFSKVTQYRLNSKLPPVDDEAMRELEGRLRCICDGRNVDIIMAARSGSEPRLFVQQLVICPQLLAAIPDDHVQECLRVVDATWPQLMDFINNPANKDRLKRLGHKAAFGNRAFNEAVDTLFYVTAGVAAEAAQGEKARNEVISKWTGSTWDIADPNDRYSTWNGRLTTWANTKTAEQTLLTAAGHHAAVVKLSKGECAHAIVVGTAPGGFRDRDKLGSCTGRKLEGCTGFWVAGAMAKGGGRGPDPRAAEEASKLEANTCVFRSARGSDAVLGELNCDAMYCFSLWTHRHWVTSQWCTATCLWLPSGAHFQDEILTTTHFQGLLSVLLTLTAAYSASHTLTSPPRPAVAPFPPSFRPHFHGVPRPPAPAAGHRLRLADAGQEGGAVRLRAAPGRWRHGGHGGVRHCGAQRAEV